MEREAKKGDTIVITKDGDGVTKGKKYTVTHTIGGLGGQAVTFYDDNNKQTTVNGFWWDFPTE